MAYSLILSIAAICLFYSSQADDVPVFLSVDESDEATVNLTCAFGLNKGDFKEAILLVSGKPIFTYNETTGGTGDGVQGSNVSLVANATENNSTVWVVVNRKQCKDDENYECKITTNSDTSGTDDKPAKCSGMVETSTTDDVTTAATNTTTAANNDNIGLYGSGVAFIIIIVTVVCLGAVFIWYLFTVRKVTANP